MGKEADVAGMMFRCKADAALTITYADDRAATVCGYSPAELVDTGFITLSDLIHPDERERVRSTIQSGLSEKSTFVIWTRLHVKDKSPADGIIIGSGSFLGPVSLSGIEGYIIRVLATPERVITGELPSPDICLQLLNHTDDVIVLLTEDGIVSYVTPAVTTTLYRTQSAIIGLSFSQMIQQSDQKRFEEFRMQVQQEEESSAQFGFVMADGESRQLMLKIIRPGGINGTILRVSYDHEQTNGKEIIETLYHDLFTLLPVPAILTTSSDIRIREMNQAAREFTSRLNLEQDSDLRESGIIDPDTIDQVREGLGAAGQIEKTDYEALEKATRIIARQIKNPDGDLILWTLMPGHDQDEMKEQEIFAP